MELTQEIVREYFEYKEGNLYWKKKSSRKTKVGDKAYNFHKSSGYIRIRFKKKLYPAHRLIFMWHHGWLPKYLDHINRIRTDNRIENLRPATSSENGANSTQPVGRSGYRGVRWNRQKQTWEAYINYRGTRVKAGGSVNKHKAAVKYNRKAVKLFGEFAVLNRICKDNPGQIYPEPQRT